MTEGKPKVEKKEAQEYAFDIRYELYADVFFIHFKKNMFALSFGQAVDAPPSKMLARIWTDFSSMKILSDFLQEQIKEYEKKYGKI